VFGPQHHADFGVIFLSLLNTACSRQDKIVYLKVKKYLDLWNIIIIISVIRYIFIKF
jgi:hypothetical protein